MKSVITLWLTVNSVIFVALAVTYILAQNGYSGYERTYQALHSHIEIARLRHAQTGLFAVNGKLEGLVNYISLYKRLRPELDRLAEDFSESRGIEFWFPVRHQKMLYDIRSFIHQQDSSVQELETLINLPKFSGMEFYDIASAEVK